MSFEEALQREMSVLVADPPTEPDRFVAVERRAVRLRRRRGSAAGAVLALVVGLPAGTALWPEPAPPAYLTTAAPRNVVVRTEENRLATLSGVPGTLTTLDTAVTALKDPRQLRTGEIVALRGERLVVVSRSGVRELGRSDAVVLGLADRTLWLVERRDTAMSLDDPQKPFRYGGDDVQRVTVDGRTGPRYRLPDDMRLAGEVADGLLAYRLMSHTVEEVVVEENERGYSYTDKVDLVVVDPVTGRVVRTVGEDAQVADAYGDTLVWKHSGCSDVAECSYRVVDRRTGATRLVDRDDYFSGSLSGYRLSPDGRWLAYWRSADDDDLSGLVVVSLTTGDYHHVTTQPASSGASFVWSAGRLLFVTPDRQRVGVHVPATGRTAYAAVPDAAQVLGALDVAGR